MQTNIRISLFKKSYLSYICAFLINYLQPFTIWQTLEDEIYETKSNSAFQFQTSGMRNLINNKIKIITHPLILVVRAIKINSGTRDSFYLKKKPYYFVLLFFFSFSIKFLLISNGIGDKIKTKKLLNEIMLISIFMRHLGPKKKNFFS